MPAATADGRRLFERLAASAHFVVECFPPGRLDQGQHRVCAVGGFLVGEIDAGIDVVQQAAHEQNHGNVRCLAVADGARLDGFEFEKIVRQRSRTNPGKAAEGGIGAARVARVG